MKHSVDYRVYYEDTDAGGVMYHASFIRFCERGRSELLRAAGLGCATLEEERGIIFVIRHLEADYHKPARLDDLLTVKSSIKEMKNSSFVMEQTIFCQDSMLFSAAVTVVCVDKQNVRPVRLPEDVRAQFTDYVEKD